VNEEEGPNGHMLRSDYAICWNELLFASRSSGFGRLIPSNPSGNMGTLSTREVVNERTQFGALELR
jgi:hypothetical protein